LGKQKPWIGAALLGVLAREIFENEELDESYAIPPAIEPGKPVQNAFIESFNAKMRDECLNEDRLTSLGEARETIEARRKDYNEVRLHTWLGNRTP
jgi:transposase InsO family protein